MLYRPALAGLALPLALLGTAHAGDAFCPPLQEEGIYELDFNPAFVHVDAYDTGLGFKADGLTISSFFNVAFPGGSMQVLGPDLAARIPLLDWSWPGNFDVEILTDRAPGMPKTVWPNDVERVPDGVLPFEAVIVPQGFHPAAFPGRLTAVDVTSGVEYVIHQSTQTGDFTGPFDPTNQPRFYHQALFMDMNGDGLDDIVTVRSGFRVGRFFHPPSGELVYFVNPGDDLDPATPWREVLLWGGPVAQFMGPDVNLAAHDFDGDGVPEIVATHFFTGEAAVPGGPPPMNGTIDLYGAPAGGTWADVDMNQGRFPRVAVLSDDQGFPFDVEVTDLNLDGRADILATNHQPDNCLPFTSSAVPGRVYALEQPASGDLFADPWSVHILLDDIRPQPSVAPVNPPGRLAPGRARAFWPLGILRGYFKPHIVVGGDEAGKVWVLRPTSGWDPDNWSYDSAVVFDINDYYGPATTQTPLIDRPGITVSTIGGVAVRNRGPYGFGHAELYIPVFEGRDIHVLRYGGGPWFSRVDCPADETLVCPAPPVP